LRFGVRRERDFGVDFEVEGEWMEDEDWSCGRESGFMEDAAGEAQGDGETGDVGPVLVDSTSLE